MVSRVIEFDADCCILSKREWSERLMHEQSRHWPPRSPFHHRSTTVMSLTLREHAEPLTRAQPQNARDDGDAHYLLRDAEARCRRR